MALSQVVTDIEQLQTQRIGYMALSLTNYDNDAEPAVAEGSVLEIGGALYEAAADEAITGWAGIGTDSTVYIKMNATTKGIEFTTTPPTWSTSKQGWYGTGGAVLDRYLGRLWKDASGNYSFKELYGGFSAGGHPIIEVGDLVPSTSKDKRGYLWCDASVISNISNPEYARLIYQLKKEAGADAAHPLYHADADKATLPDFRGYGIRGKTGAAVSARDQDGDRKAGHYQADGNKSHSHTLNTWSAGGAGGFRIDKVSSTTPSVEAGWINTDGNTEATMKNAAAYVLIKF